MNKKGKASINLKLTKNDLDFDNNNIIADLN